MPSTGNVLMMWSVEATAIVPTALNVLGTFAGNCRGAGKMHNATRANIVRTHPVFAYRGPIALTTMTVARTSVVTEEIACRRLAGPMMNAAVN